MNMFDVDVVMCSISFASFLGEYRFLGTSSFLEVAIQELAVMVSP